MSTQSRRFFIFLLIFVLFFSFVEKARAVLPLLIAAELIAEAGFDIEVSSAIATTLQSIPVAANSAAIVANDSYFGSAATPWITGGVALGLFTLWSHFQGSDGISHVYKDQIPLTIGDTTQLSYAPQLSPTDVTALIQMTYDRDCALPVPLILLPGQCPVHVTSCSVVSSSASSMFVNCSYTDVSGVTHTLGTDVGLGQPIESTDGIRRWQRTAQGFKPDLTDPDWYNNGQHQPTSTAGALRYKVSGQSVIDIASQSDGSINVEKTVQSDATHTRTDTLKLAPDQTAQSLTKGTPTVSDINNLPPPNDTSNPNPPPTLTIPTDYARQGEAATAAAPIVQRLDKLHDDLLYPGTESPDPTLSNPIEFTDSFFKGTFTNLLAWRLPSHSGACPAPNLDYTLFGRSYHFVINQHCTLIEPYRSELATVMQVVYLVFALFIILGA